MSFLTFYCLVACIFAIIMAASVKTGDIPVTTANDALVIVALSGLFWPAILVQVIMILMSK